MDQEKLIQIIKGGEDSYTEFKSQAIDDRNLAKTICAFLILIKTMLCFKK